MKQFFITTMLVSLVAGVSAQDLIYREAPQTYEIGLSVGMNFWRILDQNTSPLQYRSGQETFKLHFNYYTRKSVFTVGLRGAAGVLFPDHFRNRDVWFREIDGNGTVKDVPVRANGSLVSLRFDAGYHYLLFSSESKSQWMSGVILSESIYNPNGFTRPGLMNMLSLKPSVIYQYNLSDDHKFILNGNFPLLSCVTRMPYDNTVSLPGKGIVPGFFEKGTTLSSIGNVMQFEGGLGYQATINSKLMAGVNYRYEWTRIKNPRPLNMSENTVSALVSYLLK